MQVAAQVMVDSGSAIEYLFSPSKTSLNRMRKKDREDSPELSRRAFTRGAAWAAAGAVVLPKLVEGQQAPPPSSSAPVAAPEKKPEAAGQEKKLSPAAEAEAEAKFNQVIRTYGSRLSPEQKEEARQQLNDQVKALESIRKAALDNSVQPATVLKVMRKA